MKGKWKRKGNSEFPFFRSVTSRSQNVFSGRYTPGWGFWWKSGPCFFTKSVKFGFGELSISQICAESRDLQSGHGFRACSFKNKRTSRIFIFLGSTTKQKLKQKWWNRSIFGLRSSRWYQKMRKTGADIFAKSGLEKPGKHRKIKIFSGISQFFLWI